MSGKRKGLCCTGCQPTLPAPESDRGSVEEAQGLSDAQAILRLSGRVEEAVCRALHLLGAVGFNVYLEVLSSRLPESRWIGGLVLGDTLSDRYLLTGLLGTGGMAEVSWPTTSRSTATSR